jgi:hypothetical protein
MRLPLLSAAQTGCSIASGAIAKTFADSPVPWPCGSCAGLVLGMTVTGGCTV